MDAYDRTPIVQRGRSSRNPLLDPRPGDVVAFLLAHPDDESLFTGGTLARLAEARAVTVLITATLGERGRPPDPLARASLGDDVPLGSVRKDELRRACSALGVTHQVFLGAEGRFVDSGCSPSAWPDNCLARNSDAATFELMDVLRRVRPHLLVTFDRDGCTGHPDHLVCHDIGLRAAAALSALEDQRCGLALIVDPKTTGARAGTSVIGIDIRPVHHRKATAVGCHFSQVGNSVEDHTRLALFDRSSAVAKYVPRVLSKRTGSLHERYVFKPAVQLAATRDV